MMRVKITLILIMLSLWGGCALHPKKNSQNGQRISEYTLGAVLWLQKAAESRGLQYMAFSYAKLRLDEELKKTPRPKAKTKSKSKSNSKSNSKLKMSPAIIVDVDETVLDNTAYQAQNILENKNYPEGWKEWVKKEKAIPIPGSLEFLKYANQKRVEIFYVTNRKLDEVGPTYNNLINLGYPVEKENILPRTQENSKEKRRKLIGSDHQILLLIGDNLNDFSGLFEDKTVSARMVAVDQQKDEFGKKWIVLPNPIYGDWEGAIYEYNWKKTSEEKANDRLKSLRNFGY